MANTTITLGREIISFETNKFGLEPKGLAGADSVRLDVPIKIKKSNRLLFASSSFVSNTKVSFIRKDGMQCNLYIYYDKKIDDITRKNFSNFIRNILLPESKYHSPIKVIYGSQDRPNFKFLALALSALFLVNIQLEIGNSISMYVYN